MLLIIYLLSRIINLLFNFIEVNKLIGNIALTLYFLALTNVAYLSNNGIEYGDLKADLNSEGSEYSVQLPFENLLFSKFSGQNLQVGYVLKTDLKPYIPKPIILYDYGSLQSCDFYLKGTGSAENITTYNAFVIFFYF